ncbi:MAG: peptidase S10 [Acidobacteria bacterium]|nr:peptidase S10 [Acidobacteriota bacterium]
MILAEEEGKKRASFFYVSYTRDDVQDVSARPIVFSFNGGPGSASVWLHLGALGPRRVLMSDEGWTLPPPSKLVANEHSILDVADLVFIDPISTGYSRAIPEKKAKDFHHFTKDIESVGQFIRLYLTRNMRWNSPKFIAGESYGTTRAVGLAGHLFNRYGVAFNGLLLISAILNFQTAGFDRKTWTFQRGNDLPYALFLPTYAATSHYHGALGDAEQALSLRELLDVVEKFAASAYQLGLFAGTSIDTEDEAAILDELERVTGLSREYLDRYNMRIEILRYCREVLRDRNRTVGRIDSRYTGIDRFTDGDTMENDPSIDAVSSAYSSALNHYLPADLGYESDLPYEILSDRVHPWNYEAFQNAYVDVSETLRDTMSRNRHMKVLVTNGYYDLATPYFATEYTFNHMDLDPEIRDNVTMEYYEAGHMMYVHLPSLEKLASDMRSFITEAT